MGTFDVVYVSANASEEAAALLNIDRQSAEVVEVVRSIREAISEAHQAGTLTFGEQISASEEGDLKDLSTMHLLSNLSGADTVVIDDRALNKDGFILPSDSVVVRVATTLDILEEMRLRGAISEDDWLAYRHRLRVMGTSLIDLEAREVRAAVQRSGQAESPEFREITNGIALARVRKMPRFPAEIPWYTSVNIAMRAGLKLVWNTEPHKGRAAALADLILSAIPRAEDWVAMWEGEVPSNWSRGENRTTYASLAFGIEIDDPQTRAAYLDWISRRVLQEIQITDPDMYREIVEQLKNAISITVDARRD